MDNPTMPLSSLLDALASAIAERVSRRLAPPTITAPVKNLSPADASLEELRRHSPLTPQQRAGLKLRGRKLDMQCRWPWCRQRSGGPNKGFMCAKHANKPKDKQAAARLAYNARKAA